MQTLSLIQLIPAAKDAVHALDVNEIFYVDVPDGTWERITERVLPKVSGIEKLDCWLELYDENDDLVSDEPFTIRAHQAQWLARDFFKTKKRFWGKIKLPDSSREKRVLPLPG